MKRDKAIWITLLVLISAILLFIIFRKENEKFNWYKTFESTTLHPYDFGVFEALIQKGGKNKFTSVKESLNQYLDTHTMCILDQVILVLVLIKQKLALIYLGKFYLCFNWKKIKLMKFSNLIFLTFLLLLQLN